MDEEYPILEYLIIVLPLEDVNTILIFPKHIKRLIYATSGLVASGFLSALSAS